MREELQKNLYRDHAHLFRQKDLPSSETCLCWGIECDDGWYDIINELCFDIEKALEKETKEFRDEFAVVQVKEKFGGLRFYVNIENDVISRLINDAHDDSLNTCEICGCMGKPIVTGGWIKTLCPDCAKKKIDDEGK